MMNSNLIVFEGSNIEVLTKKDVNVDFEGEVLFHSKQTATMLGYKNTSDAVIKHTKEKHRLILKNSNIAKCDFRILTNRGEGFLTEKGVFALIMNSSLPSAEKFQDLVFEIVMQVKQTGKFDAIEYQIKNIQDTKERDLTLGLYSLQQALKSNPNDYTLSLLCNNKQMELSQYKQEQQINLLQEEQKTIKEEQIQIKEQVENMCVVGNRTEFTSEVKSVARATSKNYNEIYNSTYKKLRDLYGIDLEQRSKNKKDKLQKERIKDGKKPYAPSTLDTKAGKLTIVSEMNIWREISQSLYAVKIDLLKQGGKIK